MKVISSKLVSCETEKVLYSYEEDYLSDIKKRKEQGWKVASKPDFYDEKMKDVQKYLPNGIMTTYVRYGHVKI